MLTSLLIHPQELTKKWIDRLADAGVRILGIHPVGGANANDSLPSLLEQLEDPKFLELLDYAKSRGLEIEYEIHAVGWLVPRSLFADKPEYFRMNEAGERTPDYNFCVSNPEALALCTERAVQVAKKLYGSRPYYYLWTDDRTNSHCHCPKCRQLSPSDQQLTVINAMARALAEQIPGAKIAYLAYHDHVKPPRLKPAENVFLEYAPIGRYVAKGPDAQSRIQTEWDSQPGLKAVFGETDLKVLEYWFDNSLFSKWTKPPKAFALDVAAMERDIAHYKAWGAQQIASFACYLGEDYEALHGDIDITPFPRATDK